MMYMCSTKDNMPKSDASNYPSSKSFQTSIHVKGHHLSLKIFHAHDGRLQLHKQTFTRTAGSASTQGLHLRKREARVETQTKFDNPHLSKGKLMRQC